MEYTIFVEHDDKGGWYVGQCEQVPQAMSQGRTMEELMANMKEAIEFALECIREETRNRWTGRTFTRQRLAVAV